MTKQKSQAVPAKKIDHLNGQVAGNFQRALTNTKSKSISKFIKHVDPSVNQRASLSNDTMKLTEFFLQLEEKKNFKKLLKHSAKALKKYPKNAVFLALNATANLHLGFYERAEQSITKAIDLNRKSATLLNTLAAIKEAKGETDTAINVLRKAIAMSPSDYLIALNIGKLLLKTHDYHGAEQYFKKAIKLKPYVYENNFYLAKAHHLCGDVPKSLEAFIKCTFLEPNNPAGYFGITDCLQNVRFTKPIPHLNEILQKILTNGWYSRSSYIVTAAASVIKQEPVFAEILKNFAENDKPISVEELVHKCPGTKILLPVMKTANIADLEIENLLRYCRAAILMSLDDLNKSPEFLNFLEALSLQCFGNEYLYPELSEETLILKMLEEKIEIDIANKSTLDPFEICILSCYRPLLDFNWTKDISFPEELQTIQKRQVTEPLYENELKSKIPSISGMNDLTSIQIQEQYETNPYPRWTSNVIQPAQNSLLDFVKTSNLNVDLDALTPSKDIHTMIAGCGTGQHILSSLHSFHSSKILALDLSLSSLAYARRKVEELNIENVEFLQGDILNLSEVEDHFDVIECSGVLHHMAEPMLGWSMLCDQLRSGGLMKIGLYSASARKDISTIRQEISKLRIEPSEQNMRVFRNHLINSNVEHNNGLLDNGDFYSLSNFRDLLFNVHESHFTIPQIKETLSQLGLVFCGLSNWRSVIRSGHTVPYGKPSYFDLDWWNDFEKLNPSAFLGMYQFWCQKK